MKGEHRLPAAITARPAIDQIPRQGRVHEGPDRRVWRGACHGEQPLSHCCAARGEMARVACMGYSAMTRYSMYIYVGSTAVHGCRAHAYGGCERPIGGAVVCGRASESGPELRIRATCMRAATFVPRVTSVPLCSRPIKLLGDWQARCGRYGRRIDTHECTRMTAVAGIRACARTSLPRGPPTKTRPEVA